AIDYHYTDTEPPFVITWDFTLSKLGFSDFLPSQPSTPGTPTTETGSVKRIQSISEMSFLTKGAESEPLRKGVIVPIAYLDEADEYLSRALELLPVKGARSKGFLAVPKRKPAGSFDDESTSVCNIAVRDVESLSDREISERAFALLQDNIDDLLAHGI